MRVLMVHNYYQQRGGEDAVYEAEAALLEAYGHSVQRTELYNSVIQDKRTIRATAQLAIDTVWSRSSEQRLTEIISDFRPDVAHFHNTFPLVSPSVYRACKRASVPVVQTLHNFRILCANGVLFRDGAICEDCLAHKVGWPGVRHACYRNSRSATAVLTAMQVTHRCLGTWKNDVDLYLALSEHSRRIFIRGGLPEERIHVKPNFVQDLGKPTRCRGTGAIFVGRLSEEKGIGTLLDSWRQVHSHIPLTIIGDGPLSSLVRAAVEQDPRIKWLGHQSFELAMQYTREASLLISPSACYETFGRTIIEAFSCGTPVIASTLGPAEDLVAPGKTGWHFRSGHSVDLARVVEEAFADPDKLSEMGKAAREKYELKYTPAEGYQRLLDSYKRAVERHACSSHHSF